MGWGDILESRDKVLSISFSDMYSRDHKQMLSNFYLQGAVLTAYSEGQWHPDRSRRTERYSTGPLFPDSDVVRQSVTIEPSDRNELFFISPYWVRSDPEDILPLDDHQRLVRESWRVNRRFDYRLGTTGIVNWQQRTAGARHGARRRENRQVYHCAPRN